MPGEIAHRRGLAARITLTVLVAGSIALAACGEDDAGTATVPTTPDRPAPAAAEFPDRPGMTLGEVIDEADPPDPGDPNVAVLTQVFYAGTPGGSRYSLTLTDRDDQEITGADVALYAAPVPPEGSGASGGAFGAAAIGPRPARLISLAAEAEHVSETTREGEHLASAFYVTEIPFPAEGEWRVVAMIRHDGKLIAQTLPVAVVGEYRGIPRPGTVAPVISTPTGEETGSDREELSTRTPPSTMNELDFADVIGERPIALLFASPEFCQSRVCSPVVDVAEQVKEEYADQVAFIQMEIYAQNDPSLGVRPQVRRYNLPSEPWLFVIDREGVVSSAIEGPFGAGEMRKAVEEVAGG